MSILGKLLFLVFLVFEETVSQNDITPFSLSIVHFNDFHSRFEPTSPSGGVCKEITKCIGGFSRLYKQIKTMLEINPRYIVLNAGDTFHGTMWYSLGTWNVSQQFMNKLPMDAETVGNHEFQHGIQGLVPYINALKHPIVISNVDDILEPDFQGIYNKSIIIERHGKKIGIIGVVSSEYPLLCDSGKLKFLDESASVNEEAERLVREEGVFTNIVLSHCGYQMDKKLAANASERISLIVGSHSHSFLWTGDNPPGPDEVVGPYPTVIVSKNKHKILITQASSFARYLGNITIFLDESGEILEYSGAPIFLSPLLPQDKQINAELEPWKKVIDGEGKQIIGSTLVTLSTTGCYNRECTIGNFVTDAMVFAYTNITSDSAWTEAAVAFVNADGIRADLPAGDITLMDLTTSFPFDDTYDIGVWSGKDLLHILEFTVQGYTPENPTSALKLLQVSGMKVVYDLSRPVGRRVVSTKIRCQNCTVPIYEDLDLNKDYNIATCHFLLTGALGFEILKDRVKDVRVGRNHTDVLIDYLSRKSPIFQEEQGRIIFK